MALPLARLRCRHGQDSGRPASAGTVGIGRAVRRLRRAPKAKARRIASDGFLFERRAKVGIVAHGNARVFVSQLLRQNFDGHSGHESVTGVCVPENVECNAFNLCSFTRFIHWPELL